MAVVPAGFDTFMSFLWQIILLKFGKIKKNRGKQRKFCKAKLKDAWEKIKTLPA